MYPNPDYWVAFIYKRLVGEKVLFPTMTGGTVDTTRVYAHCTAQKHGEYPPGSVTLFGLNLADESSPTLQLRLSANDKTMYAYILTSDGPMTSQGILLNGKKLEMLDDHTLPDIQAVVKPLSEGLVLPPASVFFLVLPNAGFHLCK